MTTRFQWSTIWQWLLIFAAVGFLVRPLVGPRPLPRYNPTEWKSWDGFMVISYAGIARKPSEKYASPRVLDDHLRALQRAGYNPIRPEDALAFLMERRPLPSRSVLILFEAPRKDPFVRITPLLHKYGFIGTLAVPTAQFDMWGSAFLKRPDIRAISRLPHWSLASMGHHATDMLPVHADGTKGAFLSNRQWLGNRYETDNELRQRIDTDYARSQDTLESASRHPVIAYVYPSTLQQMPRGDPIVEQANASALTSRYSLAFANQGNPFNGLSANPFDLGYLRVPGSWSGQRLIEELEAFRPRQEPVTGFDEPRSWQLLNGARMVDGALLLKSGSYAWIRGSEGWENVECEWRYREAGSARISFYFRHRDPHSYVRVTIEQDTLRVQEKISDRLLGLASVRIPPSPDADRVLRIVLSGRRIRVFDRTQALTPPLPLTAATLQGRAGIGVENGSIALEGVRYEPSAAYWVMMESPRDIPQHIHASVHSILVPWDQFARGEEKHAVYHWAAQGIGIVPYIGVREIAHEQQLSKVDEALAAIRSHPLASLVSWVAVDYTPAISSRPDSDPEAQWVYVLDTDAAQRWLEHPSSAESIYHRNVLLFLDIPTSVANDILDGFLKKVPAQRLLVWRSAIVDPIPGIRFAVRPEDLWEEIAL